MNEFITLDRTSPDFNLYLLGDISADFRAIPVRSLNINKANEKVTFHLMDLKNIKRPALIKIMARLFRIDLLTLTLMPAIVTAGLLANKIHNWIHVIFALVSLFFLHAAIFCRNDYLDHMSGVDRLNEKGGSRVIQNGWLSAATVKKIYSVMLILAISVAAPVVAVQPEFLILRALPLHVYLMGLYFCILTLMYVQTRRIISMLVDHEAGIKTLPVRLGFDRAKKFIVTGLALSAIVVVGYFTSFHLDSTSFFSLPLASSILWLATKCYSVTSPLSSALYALPRKIINLHFWSGAYFVVTSLL